VWSFKDEHECFEGGLGKLIAYTITLQVHKELGLKEVYIEIMAAKICDDLAIWDPHGGASGGT